MYNITMCRSSIPLEILENIFQNSTPTELLKLRLVSKLFRQHIDGYFMRIALGAQRTPSLNLFFPRISIAATPELVNQSVVRLFENTFRFAPTEPQNHLICHLESAANFARVQSFIQFYKRIRVYIPTEYLQQAPVETADIYAYEAELKRFLFTHRAVFETVGILDLNGCSLSCLPNEIGYFTHLIELNLARNGLSTLPDELAHCTLLDDINLEHNFFREIPSVLCSMTQISNLDFSNNLLRSLPSELANLEGLRALILDNNQIAELPTSFSNLTRLQCFNLRRNRFTEFPEVITCMRNLLNLNLNDNLITAISPRICRLDKLVQLNLSSNFIESLPTELHLLSRLRTLNLSRNSIRQIPPSFSEFRTLNDLDVTWNQLETLPIELATLVDQLKRFCFANNPYYSLPQGLAELICRFDWLARPVRAARLLSLA